MKASLKIITRYRPNFGAKILKYSTTPSSTRPYEEIRIPVPWGHLAGKWWGPLDRRPILASHGWQDNSGSFDPLVEHLPADLPVLAFDFPGHGFSSQLPNGCYYHAIDSSILLNRIIDHFKWPKVTLLGHSMGAIVNYTFSMLYPDKVDFLMCIEGIKPLVFEERKLERMVKSIENFLKYDRLNAVPNSEPPAYTLDELKRLLHEGSRKSISLESSGYILSRNVRPSQKEPGKYYFARDPRLKVQNLLNFSQKEVLENACRVRCPVLLVRASRGPHVEKKEHVDQFKEIFTNCNPLFEYAMVDGNHHVHLNDPEPLAKLLCRFIQKYDSSDRSGGGLDSSFIVEKSKLVEF